MSADTKPRTVPTIRLTRSRGGNRYGYTCTCGTKLNGCASSLSAMLAADGHATDAHPAGSLLEGGAA